MKCAFILLMNESWQHGKRYKHTKNSLLKLMRVLYCKKWCCDVCRHQNLCFSTWWKRLSWNSFFLYKRWRHPIILTMTFDWNIHQKWSLIFWNCRETLTRHDVSASWSWKGSCLFFYLFLAPFCGGSEAWSWGNLPCLSHFSQGKPGVPWCRVLVGARQAGVHRSVADWHEQAVVPLGTLRQLFDVSGDVKKIKWDFCLVKHVVQHLHRNHVWGFLFVCLFEQWL